MAGCGGCCPEPQFITLSTCDTFTTTGNGAGAGVVVFDNTGGPALSGYVTLTNLAISGGANDATLYNGATAVIISVLPGDSRTVFVSNITTLIVSSDTGNLIEGRVCITANQRIA
ncbi:S-Ena type endospore appendage [Bacillus mycoides]|uniref:S-Ena type endospore appendage n=1 Tax=Bacillus mycoides TaxID=1405 RepID=UPI003CFF1A0D